MNSNPSTNQLSNRIVTIERFILEEQHAVSPDAQGVLTGLLYDLALAAKFIAARTARTASADILRSTNDVHSASGSEKNGQGAPGGGLNLADFAERTIQRLNDHTGRLAVMSSEEQPHIIPIPERYETGKYVLLYDPLDGVTNIDFNVSIGTVFGIYNRASSEGRGTLEDCLQTGNNLAAAGYIIYGSSTMMVYSTGQGVHGFTLDSRIGEFLLSHPNIRFPETPQYYSVNHGHQSYWSEPVNQYTRWLQGEGSRDPLSLRYIGSLVADFHRNLLAGGIFYYPRDSRPGWSEGRLHLSYEAAPLAFLAEQAGGYASDGTQSILDIQPTKLHQRTPLYIGDRALVKKAEEFLS